VCGAIEVLELIVIDGPDEGPERDRDEHEPERNEKEENAHAPSAASILESLSALATTRSELNDMPAAAR